MLVTLARVIILTSVTKSPALSISTTIPEGAESLPDFFAFSAADIVACVIRGGAPLLSSNSGIIRESNGSKKSLKFFFNGLLTTSCLHALHKVKENVLELNFSVKSLIKIAFSFKRVTVLYFTRTELAECVLTVVLKSSH